MQNSLWVIALVFVASIAPNVNADQVVFSNLTGSTGDGGLDICGAATGCTQGGTGGEALAQSFTVSGGGFILTDAKVIVGNQNGTSPLFNVWLAQNSGGSPGSLIEQIGFNVSYSGTGTSGEVTANSITTPILLNSGTSYWLVLTPASTNTVVYWDNAPGNIGSCCLDFTYSVNGIGGWSLFQNYSGQMQIDGTPSSSVPEIDPSTGTSALTLLAGSVLIIRGRRRKEH